MASTDDTDETGTPEQRLYAYYLDLINAYEKKFLAWHERCEKIIKIYTENRKEATNPKGRKLSILWANISVLQTAVYARTPKPDIARRFKDSDPVAKAASQITERALEYTYDVEDLDGVMRLMRDDYLITARGTAWLRYDADFAPLQDGQGAGLNRRGEPLKPESERDPDDDDEAPGEELKGERVCIEHVSWRDFGHNVARNWREVFAVWRKVYLSRADGVKRFGKVFDTVELSHRSSDTTEKKDEGSPEKAKAEVYEIWDKKRGKVVWIARGLKEPLDDAEPHLHLGGFFPCPKPAYGTLSTASLVPVPDYVFYQDQAEEVDDLTSRIGYLIDQLKVAGVYAASSTDASNAIITISKPGIENCLIPVPDWTGLKDGGGIGGMIEWWPVDQVIKVIQASVEARKQLVEDIYQITGISDIMRGETDSNETASAQQIKNQWGSVRVRERQDVIAKFARGVSRIAAEIIAENFQPETLLEMTNVKLPTRQQVEQQMLQQWQQQMLQWRQQVVQAQQQAAQAQQMQQQAAAQGGLPGPQP